MPVVVLDTCVVWVPVSACSCVMAPTPTIGTEMTPAPERVWDCCTAPVLDAAPWATLLPWSDWLDDVDPEEEVAVWLVCTPWITCVCCTAPVLVEGADMTPDPPSTWTWVMLRVGHHRLQRRVGGDCGADFVSGHFAFLISTYSTSCPGVIPRAVDSGRPSISAHNSLHSRPGSLIGRRRTCCVSRSQ